jgi:amphi-Trp domain-containing protein
MKEERDIEKDYSTAEFVAKLRRLADALENDEKFEIQIANERIYVPVRAQYNIEHERDDSGEEIEFQIKWSHE